MDAAHGDALVLASAAFDLERCLGVGEGSGDLLLAGVVGKPSRLGQDSGDGWLYVSGDLAVGSARHGQGGRFWRVCEVDVIDVPDGVLGDDAFVVVGDLDEVDRRDGVSPIEDRDLCPWAVPIVVPAREAATPRSLVAREASITGVVSSVSAVVQSAPSSSEV